MKLKFEIPDEIVPELAAALGRMPGDSSDIEEFVESVIRSQVKATIINYMTQKEVDLTRLRMADMITGI